ncbi:cytochrome c peroxidase [Duganella sp. SG902]|uniref:cytochrome-c peroxidase n=1 Tax=Duganella sp. SG902 TaxID=2587016 RepID=UPI00159E88D4|nr:cytochrome c peroxidase [Duganella sp. SG902]NVM80015.1 cytochrome c peroxidase [Duganella sp. SG902]
MKPGLPTAGLLAALSLPPQCGAAPLPDEPIKPVPLSLQQPPAAVALGRRLFNDARLSANNRVSCASCHDLARGGADARPRSAGLNGKPTLLNTPTVLNAALNFRQFWDGRADTLEAQIDLVVRNPLEMGSDWGAVMAKLQADGAYRRDFASAYRDGLTAANVRNAIASYERTLITPNSRFDQYLRGNHNAITEAEKNGYAKFKQYGCVACHQGVNVGGNMFQKFGVMGDYFARRGGAGAADMGRYQVTGKADDLHVFKVPGLRNVARTAPYFHDASAATLEEAVDVMFKFQLGRTGSKEDKAAIVKFLHTLNGTPAGQP